MKRMVNCLIVGLGNPGLKYNLTRHNVGFMVVDSLAKKLNLSFDKSAHMNLEYCSTTLDFDFKKLRKELLKKHKHRIEEYKKHQEKHPNLKPIPEVLTDEEIEKQMKKIVKFPLVHLHLLKPQSFMNLSGGPLRHYLEFIEMKIQPNPKQKLKRDRILVVCDDVSIPFGTIRLRTSGSSGGHNGLADVEKKLGTTHYHRLKVGIGNPLQRDMCSHVLSKFSPMERNTMPQLMEVCTKTLVDYIHKDVAIVMNVANATKIELSEE